jgi:hypothetical protein
MTQLIEILVANPLYDLEVAFSLSAALAFVLFLRGFFSGFWHVLKIDGNEYYMEIYRTRAVWGAMILLALFVLWECLRLIGGLIMGTLSGGLLWLALILIAVIIVFFVLQLLFG